ncbi:MAG: 3-oxoacyl-ACP reductase family protein [Deltaproteobacteria bacterium]
MRLKDKVVIVTGGARGLGKTYALALSSEGARVVVTDVLDPREAQKAIEEKGGEALALRMDVSDEKGTMEMAQKTVERFGRIDVLINNAALFANIVKRPFYEIPGEEWDNVIRVNLKGTFLCCKAVYPQMKKQGKGKIINISSGTWFKGSPYFVHYVTSKAGVVGMTRAMAREVGADGISVNAVAPGLTESEALVQKPQDSGEIISATVNSRCFKRVEQPEDLIGTILFLASDESDFITGQTLVVDGGSTFH